MIKTSLYAPGPTPVPPEALLEVVLAKSSHPVALGAGGAAAMKVFQD